MSTPAIDLTRYPASAPALALIMSRPYTEGELKHLVSVASSAIRLFFRCFTLAAWVMKRRAMTWCAYQYNRVFGSLLLAWGLAIGGWSGFVAFLTFYILMRQGQQ